MAFPTNIAKAKAKTYGELPLANDAIIWVLIANAGMEGDEVFRDADTLAALLAGATNEITDLGYSRQTATGVTVTVSDTTDDVLIDAADPTWTITAVSPTPIGAVVACYDDDTTGGTDTNLIPFFVDKLASPFTPTTNVAFPYVVATGGFYRAV